MDFSLDLLVIPQEFLSGNVPHRTHAAETLLLLFKPCYLHLESLTISEVCSLSCPEHSSSI